ncbi:hypothetical protein BBBOND_0108970 [Babesia bigemina]|uniref:Uncharacterized protein n=1 Tax=Babesia bigemina TaxID=5866 RepID=A0A061D6M6_BABBI|nr:hypothetical protein BBBOND_0108970 [Babesia bigemina]CDR94599.1 hypothetical protein BBBOND_0108970 [Babesia bigemina]|eukprot:XP_012766785.1 hypothetical protein BBBOND_0108970 [Babesia bigemina]
MRGWLRELGTAVAEGTGSGEGRWEGTCGRVYVILDVEGNEYKCKCKCCLQKCSSKEKPGICIPPPPAPPPPLSSTGSESSSASSSVIPAPGVAGARSGGPGPDGEDMSTTSPTFSPSPETIAAVIVAIIVAIILLDLCIFRFPVGRNIRDFLVRKIPFCIAFYS